MALEHEKNNTLALQQSLDENLERYKKEELRTKSLHDEFKRQSSVQDNLENTYLNHRSELENKIAMLQKALEEAQNQLTEKEENIAVLTAARDEMIFTVVEVEEPTEPRNLAQNSEEHQKHLISEIEQLSAALDKERESVSILQNNLTELQARVAEAEQKRAAESEESHAELQNQISFLQQSLDEGQRLQKEQDQMIEALSTAKEDLLNTLAAERNLLSELQARVINANSQESVEELGIHVEYGNIIALFQKSFDQRQKQLAEKEETIEALSTAKEDLINNLAAERNNLSELQARVIDANRQESVEQLAMHAEYENIIALFQESLDQGQKQLAEKEDAIQALSMAKEDLLNTLALEKNKLTELQAQFAEAQEKRASESQHNAVQLAAQAELELRISLLEKFIDEEQKQLTEKEEMIQTLSATKEDLLTIFAAERNRLTGQVQDNHEHKLHLIADIDSLTVALESEQQNALVLKQSLEDLNAQHQQEQQRQASLAHQESQVISRGAMEDNFYSEIEALDSLVYEKQQRIDRLESELRETAYTHQAHRTELELNLANLMQALEQEKMNLAKKEHELLEARDKQASLSQFAGNLENQLQALTQRSSSFGDEFAQTQQKLNETQKEYNALLEINQFLHQQALLNEERLHDQVQQNNQLQEHVITLTTQTKELTQSMEEKDYVQNIEKLLIALDLEQQRAEQLENELKRQNQNEQQVVKLAVAEATIQSLTAETQTYKEELTVRDEEINRLGDGVSNLQEMTDLVKNYEDALVQARKGHEELAHQLEQEKQAAEEMSGMVQRLSEIVNMQKNALERIEQSQQVLREES